MQIEHVAGIGFTAGAALQQQGQGAVSDGVLGQIVVDDQHVPALVHEVFAQAAPCVGGDILQGSRVAGRGADDDAVVHGAPLAQVLGQQGHRACLLTDGYIDADDVFALLVQDGVQGHGGLAGLAVADDQLTLAPADGEQSVDGQQAGLHGLIDRLAVDDAGSGPLHGVEGVGLDGVAAVDGAAQGIHHPAQEAFAHRDAGHLAGADDGVAGLDVAAVAEQHAAQLVGAQFLYHAPDAVGKQQHFAVDGVLQAADGGDLIPHRQHGADLLGFDVGPPVLDGLAHQGQDVLLPLVQRIDAAAQLGHAALEAPVVDIGAHLQAETALQAHIPLPLQRQGAVGVGAGQKVRKPLALRLAGRVGAVKEGGSGFIRLFHVAHCVSLPLPGSKIRQRRPGWSPAPAFRRRPWPAPSALSGCRPRPWRGCSRRSCGRRR